MAFCLALALCGCVESVQPSASDVDEASSAAVREMTMDEYLQAMNPLIGQMEICLEGSFEAAKSRKWSESHDRYSEARELYQNIVDIEPPESAVWTHELFKEYAESSRAACQYYFKAVNETKEGSLERANEYLSTASNHAKKAAEWHEKANEALKEAQPQ